MAQDARVRIAFNSRMVEIMVTMALVTPGPTIRVVD